MTATPNKERNKEAFLQHIRDYFRNTDPEVDAERVVRSVFQLLSQRITRG
ncbi:hypothetical protein [Nodularia chucula]